MRSRLVQLEHVKSMSADWIAHGLLDSIVDALFPFLEEIEDEVMAVEDLVFTGEGDSTYSPTQEEESHDMATIDSADKVTEKEAPEPYTSDKATIIDRAVKTHFAPDPPRSLSLLVRRLKRHWNFRKKPQPQALEQESAKYSSLLRMARTRKLVTSLSRLLATKSDVVAQVRKRLLTASASQEQRTGDDAEIAMYMGDVQGVCGIHVS